MGVYTNYVSGQVQLEDPNNVKYDARLSKQMTVSVYSNNIRDTNEHTSGSIVMEGYRSSVLTLNNGLDQPITVKVYGSLDNSDWYQLGSDININASSKTYETLTEAWHYVKITIQCSVTPTSGTFTAKLGLRSG